MEHPRKLPDLNLEEPYYLWVRGGFSLALLAFPSLLGFLILGGVVEIRGTLVEKSICGIGVVLLLIPLGLWQAGMMIREMLREQRRLAQKRRWLESASTAQAAIVDRKAERNEYAESREEEMECDLVLRLPALPGEPPNEMLVRARVSEKIYEKYRHQDTVRIYYSEADPYLFLMDGE